MTIGKVNGQRVIADRVYGALVIRYGVVDAAIAVIGDAGQATDFGALKLSPRRNVERADELIAS